MDRFDATCPVCGGPAKQAERTTGDYQDFLCPECGQFLVSGTAMESIGKFEVRERQGFLANAKRETAHSDRDPMIRDLPTH